jgi:hypothetical protein
MKHLLLFVCLGLFVSFATGRNSSTPGSPNAPDTKASLAATLKLIQEQVNKQGQIRYTMTSKSTASGETVQDKYLVETSNAVGDANSCSLQVDARMVLNGVTQAQGRPVVSLRNIDAIIVKSQSQAIEEKTKQAGVKEWTGTIPLKATRFRPFSLVDWQECSFSATRRRQVWLQKTSALPWNCAEVGNQPSTQNNQIAIQDHIYRACPSTSFSGTTNRELPYPCHVPLGGEDESTSARDPRALSENPGIAEALIESW